MQTNCIALRKLRKVLAIAEYHTLANICMTYRSLHSRLSRRVSLSISDHSKLSALLLLLDPQIYFAFELSVIHQVLLCQRCSASNTPQPQNSVTALAGVCSGLKRSTCSVLFLT